METSDELDDINENMLRELVLDQFLKFIVAAFKFQSKVSVESLDA